MPFLAFDPGKCSMTGMNNQEDVYQAREKIRERGGRK
jgi:TATA-box binding protein (TBP) (component of TFIID and TFIIIB)